MLVTSHPQLIKIRYSQFSDLNNTKFKTFLRVIVEHIDLG